MKKRIIVYFIIFQLAVISGIAWQIYKKHSVLGTQTSVNVGKREEQIFPKVDGLKYFFEPKPNRIIIIELDWENVNGTKTATYKINADGLNQIQNFPSETPKGTFRIVTLGDSFTFGANVNTEDNYPSQLQAMLNKECKYSKFEVLNLGVGGYDIQYTIERYKIRGQKYNPDLILWFIIQDDLNRLQDLFSSRATQLEYEMIQTGELQAKTPEDMRPHPLWHRAKQDIFEKMGIDKILDLQKSYMLELNNLFNKKLVVFTFPHIQAEYKNVLLQFVKSREGIFFYDSLPVQNGVNTLPDRHPSPLGHKLIAENLFDYLTKNKLIPCSN